MIRTYSEMARLATFEERYRYLRLAGKVAEDTFGFDRYINQRFYKSAEWKRIRSFVIARDEGRDLGAAGRDIFDKILIHHMNPIALEDFKAGDAAMLDPEYLITTTLQTHNAIHYGDESLLLTEPAERRPNDTCPWRR